MEFKNTMELLIKGIGEIRQLMQQMDNDDKIRTIDLDLALDKLRNIYDLMLEMRLIISPGKIKSPGDIDFIDNDKPVEEQKEYSSIEVKKELNEKEVAENIPAGKDNVTSDRFKTTKPSINDEIAQKAKAQNLTSRIRGKPILNLSMAFGINDKFELIKELFNGDKELFEKTIQVLNSAGSFVEAYNYLEQNFDWDMDDPYVQRILELIRRKLIVGRDES
ncbi:MAG: hypothetical protein JW894_06325 [Bacteroidales bacterium]|nr:hypothetical protein [Bacteroidales bacterium]